MINAIGTYTAALIIATTMGFSTVPATASASTLVATSPNLAQPSAPAENSWLSLGDDAWTISTVDHRSRLHAIWAKRWRALSLKPIKSEVATWQHEFEVFKKLESGPDNNAFAYKSGWLFNEMTIVPPPLNQISFASLNDINQDVAHLRTVIPESDPALLQDAARFYSFVKELAWHPKIWSDDGEVAFEWIRDGKHAIVSFDGDGRYGYALKQDGHFHAGLVEDPTPGVFPDDLRKYLENA